MKNGHISKTIRTKKGQSSMEMLTTVGIFIAFLVPVALLAFSVVNLNRQDISKYAAESMVKQIASESNNIYAQGYSTVSNIGASSIIYINIPGGVKSIEFVNNSVVAHLNIGGSPYDAVAYTNAPFSGDIKPIKDKQGILPIRVFATLDDKQNTVIQIEEVGGNNE